jgi:hypothetical protein
MLRTIELILGLPPLSQYGAAATPMYGAFQTRLDLELNEIVWRSVKGAESPMPPSRRAAFVRAIDDDEGSEE